MTPRTIEVWPSVDHSRHDEPRAKDLWYVTAEGGDRKVAVLGAYPTETEARRFAEYYGALYLQSESS